MVLLNKIIMIKAPLAVKKRYLLLCIMFGDTYILLDAFSCFKTNKKTNFFWPLVSFHIYDLSRNQICVFYVIDSNWQ